MSRVPYLAPLFAFVLVAATTASIASTQTLSVQPPPAPEPAKLEALMEPLATSFGIEPGIRLSRTGRDLVHETVDRVEDWFAALSEQGDVRIPDISVLTTEPIAGASKSTSGFGWREDPFNHNHKFHHGADLKGKHGTPVMAAGNGVVTFAGDQNGYGNVIYVDHGGGVVTRYAHLRKIEVKKHDAIIAGQRIGQVGSTGHATGPHLHFEVRLDGNSVDPMTALSIAQLWRESPSAGRVAAFVLAPRIQAAKLSDVDPPKTTTEKSRPERSGRAKRVTPTS